MGAGISSSESISSITGWGCSSSSSVCCTHSGASSLRSPGWVTSSSSAAPCLAARFSSHAIASSPSLKSGAASLAMGAGISSSESISSIIDWDCLSLSLGNCSHSGGSALCSTGSVINSSSVASCLVAKFSSHAIASSPWSLSGIALGSGSCVVEIDSSTGVPISSSFIHSGVSSVGNSAASSFPRSCSQSMLSLSAIFGASSEVIAISCNHSGDSSPGVEGGLASA